MRHKITVELSGGLGNQLFQWATGYSLALETERNLTLNTVNYSENNSPKILDFLRTKPVIISEPRSKFFKLMERRATAGFNRRIKKISNGRINFLKPYYIEPSFTFERILVPKDLENLNLIGYFQSPKYFIRYRDTLIKQLNIQEFTKMFYMTYPTLENCKYLAIHVRRGDYLQHQNSLGLTTKKYYDNAIDIISKLTSFSKVVVFTDSAELIKDIICEYDLIIPDNGPDSTIRDLCGIINGRSLIGSNSTYSWWGAFLNPTNTTFHIFPRPWFKDPNLDTRDLLIDKWLQLGLG